MRGPTSILPSLLNVLKPTTQVTTQHAVVSLLRNIAIPPANKTILGDAGITELLVRMGVFDDTRDMVETVQGGAAVVIKLLCQANGKTTTVVIKASHLTTSADAPASNAENFVLSDAAVAQVLAVIKRVDTPSVAFESSRIFANCIKSLTSDHRAKHVESVARLSQSDVIEIYVDLLRRTTKYPLLTNDAVISLTLVTTFGPDGSGEYPHSGHYSPHALTGSFARSSRTRKDEICKGRGACLGQRGTGQNCFDGARRFLKRDQSEHLHAAGSIERAHRWRRVRENWSLDHLHL